jgi:hypothetical protein
MEDLGWRRRRGSSPAARKGRAAARGLDARLRLQHHFMPAGDASLKTLRSIKNPIDSDHGTYRASHRVLLFVTPLRHARLKTFAAQKHVRSFAKGVITSLLLHAHDLQREESHGNPHPSTRILYSHWASQQVHGRSRRARSSRRSDSSAAVRPSRLRPMWPRSGAA